MNIKFFVLLSLATGFHIAVADWLSAPTPTNIYDRYEAARKSVWGDTRWSEPNYHLH